MLYSSLLPNMHEVVYKHLHVLYQSDPMKEVFAEPPLVETEGIQTHVICWYMPRQIRQ